MKVLILVLAVTSHVLAETVDFTPTANTENNTVPEQVPRCFRDGNTIVQTYNCLKENGEPECFEDYGVDGLADCMVDNLDDVSTGGGILGGLLGLLQVLANFILSFFDATRVCLEPLAQCVNETIQDRIPFLNSCVNETLTKLNQCAMENSEICKDSCEATDEDTDMFSDSDFGNLRRCSNIQSEVVAPTCTSISCCEPCEAPYAELMECFINKVLPADVTRDDEDCVFECPSEPVRKLNFLDQKKKPKSSKPKRDYRPRRLDQNSDTSTVIVDQCMELSMGLTGTDTLEVESKAGIINECVAQNMKFVIMNTAANETTTEFPCGLTQEDLDALGDPINPFCNVCGEGMRVTIPDATVNLPAPLGNQTCCALQYAGFNNYVPESYCPAATAFTAPSCGCAPAPVTPSPVTPSPVETQTTPAPVTPAPVTPSPVETQTTPAPVTPAPVTPAPVTPAPVTPAPVTPAPVTPAPVEPSPEIACGLTQEDLDAVGSNDNPECNVCGEGKVVTIPDATMELPPPFGTQSCCALSYVGLNGYIPTDYCPLTTTYTSVCGCTSTGDDDDDDDDDGSVSGTPVTEKLDGLFVNLRGVTTELSPTAIEDFISASEEAFKLYYNSRRILSGRRLRTKKKISDFTTELVFDKQKVNPDRVRVFYNQTMSYTLLDGETVDPQDVAFEPIILESTRENFVNYLGSQNSEFEDLTDISSALFESVTTLETAVPTPSPVASNGDDDDDDDDDGDDDDDDDDDDNKGKPGKLKGSKNKNNNDDGGGGLSGGAIVGIVIVVLLVVGLGVFFLARNKLKKGTKEKHDGILEGQEGPLEEGTLASEGSPLKNGYKLSFKGMQKDPAMEDVPLEEAPLEEGGLAGAKDNGEAQDGSKDSNEAKVEDLLLREHNPDNAKDGMQDEAMKEKPTDENTSDAESMADEPRDEA